MKETGCAVISDRTYGFKYDAIICVTSWMVFSTYTIHSIWILVSKRYWSNTSVATIDIEDAFCCGTCEDNKARAICPWFLMWLECNGKYLFSDGFPEIIFRNLTSEIQSLLNIIQIIVTTQRKEGFPIENRVLFSPSFQTGTPTV